MISAIHRCKLKYVYSDQAIIGFIYISGNTSTSYIYQRNAINDIIGIYNNSGNIVARYIYDAYGNHTVCNPDGSLNTSSSFIGNINPIRYKGYYYDQETGLYYLNTRYYNPEWGRFISPDSIDYIDPESINGLNLYAYCLNNPVMYIDGTGHFAISLLAGTLIAFAIGSGMSVVGQGLQYGWDNINGWQILLDGAIAGGSVLLAATGIPLLGSVLVGGTLGFGQYAASSVMHEEQLTWQGALIATGLGMVSGLASGRGARHMKSITKNMSGRAEQGIRALATTAQKYGINSKQMVLVNNLYGGAINQGAKNAVSKVFTTSTLTIWGTTIGTPLFSLLLNEII